MAKTTTKKASLSDFIETHHAEIVAEWVAFARTLLPWSEGMTEEDLRDHAEELLTVVVRDMKSPQSEAESASKSRGLDPGGALGRVGKKHAVERLETGLKLDQLVSEYRALRSSVLRLWERSNDEAGEMTRFNEAIDETLAESAVWYTERMNHTREQFLAILGHDLRNPVGAIIAGATALSKSAAVDDKGARVAARILTSSRRIDRMVGDLLDLARTRLGATLPISPAAMDLTDACEQMIAELEAIHPGSRILLESTGDLGGVWDGDRLRQVISNLVANAVQHGRKDGTVHVRAVGHANAVELEVQNDGRPIPKPALKAIFDPLTREPSNGGVGNLSGLGLGLFIAREIVSAHGGTLVVTSTERDGTTFTARLPRNPSVKTTQEKAREDEAPGTLEEDRPGA